MLPALLRLVSCFGLALPLVAFADAPAAGCLARSGAYATHVVELYTSEGCSSCPPADRWLSTLRGRPDVVALSYHVGYWDRLGWKDRFASPAYTQRQAEQLHVNGARYSYTPQVVVDGTDEPRWQALPMPLASDRRSAVLLNVSRVGPEYLAQVQAQAGAPPRLAAYWAVTENGHQTAVKAGENEGATLTHDFVVREFHAVAEWQASPGRSSTLQFRPDAPVDARHPRELNLVVIDAASGRPVQAIKVGC